MNLFIHKHSAKIKATIKLPSSKSISNRLLILKAICKPDLIIENLSNAEDTQLLNRILSTKNTNYVDVGHAGTAMRFLTAYFSIQEGEYILTGSERMQNRPIKILVDALLQLGADISYMKKVGFPPLKIKGNQLKGCKISIDGSVSSQYISALMMITPLLKEGLHISLTGKISSKPYLAMTLNLMETLNCQIPVFSEKISLIENANDYKNNVFFVEPDWSSASYWYSMVALSDNADIMLQGLENKSLQGDAVVVELYKKFGVQTEFSSQGARLTKIPDFSNEEKDYSFDFTDCPDLAQTYAVTCAALNCSALLKGLSSLRIKETDRLQALVDELTNIGFDVFEKNNELIIKTIDNNKLEQIKQNEVLPIIKTYQDHRMAMAFAPLSMVFPIVIENQEVVTKSYPNFWEDIKKSGFCLEEK